MGLLVMTFHLNMVFLSNLNIHSSTLNQVKVLCSERKSSKGWRLKGKAKQLLIKTLTIEGERNVKAGLSCLLELAQSVRGGRRGQVVGVGGQPQGGRGTANILCYGGNIFPCLYPRGYLECSACAACAAWAR